MAKEPKQLADLFHDTLKDIYFAEKKILTALYGRGCICRLKRQQIPYSALDLVFPSFLFIAGAAMGLSLRANASSVSHSGGTYLRI